jgi:DNA-binding NarL/FixJ family response regulator
MPNPVLVGVNDLFFSAKIDAAAKSLSVPLRCLPTCDHVLSTAREAEPPLVILDLDSVGGDAIDLIQTLKSGDKIQQQRIIGFCRHTNTQTLADAKQAGIDQVMPRSDFVQVLPDLLRACADAA